MTPATTNDRASTSFNFSVFKVLSILCVATSHWPSLRSLPLWIPSSIGLVIFSFSSGLFTTRIYGAQFDVRAFWRKKFERLAVRYWFLLAILSILLIAEGRTVFHWHSLVHIFGLSGFLNLAGPSTSALGAGLWFFTLLLLFYLAYPFLVRTAVSSKGDFMVPLLVSLFFFYFNDAVVLPFSLWLTALGFILGVFVGIYDTQVAPRVSLSIALVALAVLLALNLLFGYHGANGTLVGIACISTNLWLVRTRLPQWGALRAIASMETFLLEIFVIHTYLFVHPTGIGPLDFALTMTLIIAVAWVLNIAGTKLVTFIFAKPQRQVTVRAPLEPQS